ncbi:hypothetical protein [Gimesia aquarii]|uniref:hypothetical protein n=1 Tax=Gimesia aquarii TaxID=2527964 RepID=UPI0011A80904|nr:hypothetical protein [Gimesia aquarii]
MNTLEQEICESRIELDKWLREIYGDSYGNFHGENDIGYDHWDRIEKLLKKVFESENHHALADSCLDDILFLISRSDEGGRIIAWLHPNVKPLSHIADLTIENFIVLCKHAIKSGEDFCDYQLAYCFHKFDSLSKDLEELLIGLFKKDAVYTKRLALESLAKHRVPNLENYITELWATNDEWAGLNCLDALKVSGCNDELFNKYREKLLKSNDEHIRTNAESI